jgi:hypothetical protein
MKNINFLFERIIFLLVESCRSLNTIEKSYTVYGDKIESVTVSNRIAKSPLVIVTGRYGWSANMERIMAAQTFSNQNEHQYMLSKKTVEINPHHPIIKTIAEKITSESDEVKDSMKDLANLLYDAALLQSGFVHKTPNDFAQRIHRVVSTGLQLDHNAQSETPEEDEETETETETTEEEDDGKEDEKEETSEAEDSTSKSDDINESSEEHEADTEHDEL